MKQQTCSSMVVGIWALMLGLIPGKAQTNLWHVDVSVYGLAAGMSGDVTLRGLDADLDVGFDDILDSLEFGAMGRVKVGYDRWSVSTDLVYVGLGASKGPVSADFDQWLVQPALEYRFSQYVDAYAGARYNNLSGEIRGPFAANPSDTQDWWDPVVGTRVRVPIAGDWSVGLSGDLGGFGAGSDLTWQVEPLLNWRFSEWGSLQAGYRWLYTDYESGSGTSEFRYDVLTQGAQVGLTVHF